MCLAISVLVPLIIFYHPPPPAASLQIRLGELLPRLLDGSTEVVVLKEPPKIRPNSPYDLCSRFAAVMESIHDASTVTVK